MENKEVADRLTKLYLLGQSERPIQCYTKQDLEALDLAISHFQQEAIKDELYSLL